MAEYRLSNAAKEDLIRIHHFGVERFGMNQADKYYDSFFAYFDIIAQRPFAFESIDYIKKGYRRCVCGSDSIYYRINNGIVEIMAIIGRQDSMISALLKTEKLLGLRMVIRLMVCLYL